MIPIFFSGEEFDATFRALPELSPNLYGAKDAGRGRWLYGAMLDWNEVNESVHRDMLLDVRKMISIRKQYPELLAMVPGGTAPNLRAVPHECSVNVPVPYLRWDDHSAILIAANRNRVEDAVVKTAVDLAGTGIDGHQKYAVSDLWSTSGTKIYTATELRSFECRVKRDGTRGGGLAAFRIEAA